LALSLSVAKVALLDDGLLISECRVNDGLDGGTGSDQVLHGRAMELQLAEENLGA
jgi:hypothetical protein